MSAEAYAVDYVGTTWRECATFLGTVISGARVEGGDERIVLACIGTNLLSREEQTKPCRTCGKPQHDFSYWRVTAAGRLLVNALREQSLPTDDSNVQGGA